MLAATGGTGGRGRAAVAAAWGDDSAGGTASGGASGGAASGGAASGGASDGGSGGAEPMFPEVEPNTFASRWSIPASDRMLTLPLEPGGTYDFVVDWGDGQTDVITSDDDAAVTHEYAQAGLYRGEHLGSPAWRVLRGACAGDHGRKLVEILQWGPLGLGQTPYQFQSCVLEITAVDAPPISRT